MLVKICTFLDWSSVLVEVERWFREWRVSKSRSCVMSQENVMLLCNERKEVVLLEKF